MSQAVGNAARSTVAPSAPRCWRASDPATPRLSAPCQPYRPCPRPACPREHALSPRHRRAADRRRLRSRGATICYHRTLPGRCTAGKSERGKPLLERPTLTVEMWLMDRRCQTVGSGRRRTDPDPRVGLGAACRCAPRARRHEMVRGLVQRRSEDFAAFRRQTSAGNDLDSSRVGPWLISARPVGPRRRFGGGEQPCRGLLSGVYEGVGQAEDTG